MKQQIDLEGICGELRKTASAVYLACPAPVADDIAYKLRNAASEIERLQAENERLEGADIAMEAMQALLDRAVEDLAYSHLCRHCISSRFFSVKLPPCDTCADNGKPDWQWRGFSEKGGVKDGEIN